MIESNPRRTHEQRRGGRPAPRAAPVCRTLRDDPVAQAFLLLRIAFTVAPILFGLDKFAGVLTDDWTRYLSTQFNDILPGSASDAMHIVGVVEIAAGLVVAVVPRFGGLLVAAWLAGIILNLLLVGGYGDIALRDFGLLLGALALARLATVPTGERRLRSGRRSAPPETPPWLAGRWLERSRSAPGIHGPRRPR